MAEPTKPGRAQVDWAAVERDYRTNQFTDRELGHKYGVTHAAIGKRARKEGWQKDLSGAVRQATRAALVKEAVKADAQDPAKVEVTVEAAAEANKQVILGHRKELRETRGLVTLARARLHEKFLLGPDDIALAGEMAAGDDAEPVARIKSQAHAEKMLGLSQAIQDLQRLADASVKLQQAERTAFGLDDAKDDEDKAPVTVVIKRYGAEAA